mmetsp:Transcript_67077/g.187641  ORF Transcript_67077/g.187641 Transcript_67077/m.187641 type:complete len:224 (-) Transcript_67077:214-885(-)
MHLVAVTVRRQPLRGLPQEEQVQDADQNDALHRPEKRPPLRDVVRQRGVQDLTGREQDVREPRHDVARGRVEELRGPDIGHDAGARDARAEEEPRRGVDGDVVGQGPEEAAGAEDGVGEEVGRPAPVAVRDGADEDDPERPAHEEHGVHGRRFLVVFAEQLELADGRRPGAVGAPLAQRHAAVRRLLQRRARPIAARQVPCGDAGRGEHVRERLHGRQAVHRA